MPHTAKWRVLAVAIKAATAGLGPQPSTTHYKFTPIKSTPLRLDGELRALEPGVAVTIDIAPHAPGNYHVMTRTAIRMQIDP